MLSVVRNMYDADYKKSYLNPYSNKEYWKNYEKFNRFLDHKFGSFNNINANETQDEYQKLNNHYVYIPYHADRFLKDFKEIDKTSKIKGKTFIDVGCGVGEKVFLAQQMGMKAFGIEYSDYTYQISQKVLPRTLKQRVVHGDATKFDFSGYDLIYTYCPIHSAKDYWVLGTQILNTMEEGSIWVEVYPEMFFERHEIEKFVPKCLKVSNKIYWGVVVISKFRGKFSIKNLWPGR